jgi:hypothetical protein
MYSHPGEILNDVIGLLGIAQLSVFVRSKVKLKLLLVAVDRQYNLANQIQVNALLAASDFDPVAHGFSFLRRIASAKPSAGEFILANEQD